MKFEILELENVGIYGGLHRFDFSDTDADGRNVVLVKGHNGAGKTTFLNALRLVLYGKRALGPRVGQTEYDTHILKLIHALSAERLARIFLQFQKVEDGQSFTFQLTRCWSARGGSVVESFELLRDGLAVPELPPEDWDGYIEELIPPGVSQLFFFDGEKIQEMADGSSTDGLREAIRNLLGLDIVEQLRTDLTLYVARNEGDRDERDLQGLMSEIAAIDASIQGAEQDRADLNSRRDQIASAVRRAEKVFRSEGGREATNRDLLHAQLKANRQEHDRLLQTLRSLADDILPLGLAPNVLNRFKERIALDDQHHRHASIQDFLDEFAASVDGRTSTEWSADHLGALRQFLGQPPEIESKPVAANSSFVKSRLEALTRYRQSEASSLADKLDENLAQRALLVEQIEGFEKGLAMAALENLKDLERDKVTQDLQLKQQDEVVRDLRYRRDALTKQYQRSQEALIQRAKGDRGLDLAIRTRAALEDYGAELLSARVERMAEHFSDCFNRLIRKTGLVKDVLMDSESFEVTLIGQDGVAIPRDSLSAGERQIFAVSMLWALGKTSGRALPMVIDTPFSRLDSRHRRSIVEDYVTVASEQVILLCTDTEMTEDLEGLIEPFVAKSYSLNVSAADRGTTSIPGLTERVQEVVDAH